MRSLLVPAATAGVIAFNWLAATGRLGGVDTGVISDRYTTMITPAGYAFSIWSLIYLGLIAFSVYQALPANLARFRPLRTPYIFTCALNCAWLYFWHEEQIVICFVIILALSLTLLFINFIIRTPESLADRWLAKVPFELYFGWVTAATLVNFAIMLKFLKVDLSSSAETTLGVVLILVGAGLAVVVRTRLASYIYPLAIAWALTAIAVKQSGQTAIVAAAAVGVIACLIASLSFVMNMRSTDTSGSA